MARSKISNKTTLGIKLIRTASGYLLLSREFCASSSWLSYHHFSDLTVSFHSVLRFFAWRHRTL